MKASELFPDKVTKDFVKYLCDLFNGTVTRVTNADGTIVYDTTDSYENVRVEQKIVD